jgi:Tfp pilus assembly protein PilF
LPFFDLAIRFDRKNANLLLQRGIIQFRLNWTDRAIDDLSAVLQIDPDHIVAHLWRGLVYMNTRRSQQAIADSSFVLKRVNNSPDAYFIRCVARLQLGQMDTAKADYRSAVASGLDEGARGMIKNFFEP